MTPLKLAMDYRQISSHWLHNRFLGSTLLQSEKLSARQIGSACAGKKKLTATQKDFIANALDFPIQFIDDDLKQFDTSFSSALETQLLSNYITDSTKLTT